METIPARHQPPAPCGPPRRSTAPVASLRVTAPRRGRKRAARIVLVMVATAALAGAGVAGWGALAASVALLAHLDWIWIPAAIVLELASMGALSGMQRGLLAAGGVKVGIRSMLATTFAANALSVSVPLAGPELGTVFTFRRFTRQGADVPLASWSLLVGGVVSTAAGVLVVVGGGLSSGNLPATVAAAAVGLVAAAALAAAVAAVRRPRMRSTLESLAARTLRLWQRLKHRSAEDPGPAVRAWADRLGSLRLPVSSWTAVTGLALANWLADAAVLAVSIRAAGATVPWHALLLAYGSGVAAQNLNLTPGGFGITEGALGLTLVASGLRPGQALVAVLLYRLVSFWLVAAAGWLIFLVLRRHRSLTGRRDVGQPATDGAATRHERVQAPVLRLADPADRLVPFETARRLAGALPDARLQLVAGGGHHLPRRARDAVADATAAFMAVTDFAEHRD